MSNVRVVMLGTGVPRPNISRFQTAQLLLDDDFPVLIDCGEAATYQLMKAGVQPQDVKHLLFTHLHSDHTLGYAQFLIGGWMVGRRELTVVGPKGTKKFHEKILELYEDDIQYRLQLGRPEKGIMDVNVLEIEGPGDIDCPLPYRITVDSMVHNVPTYAYRVETEEQTIVFSGDTAQTPKLPRLAKGADLFIMDAAVAKRKTVLSAEYEKIQENLKKEHCTPAQCAQIAAEAGCKKLVLTHFFPDIDEKQVYQEASAYFSGPIIVANDLDVIHVDE